MMRTVLKSKLHRVTVTDADLNYEGSISVDARLMEAADLVEHELVHVWDINNGERFETYVIAGERGSGTICVNGAAARKVHRGDLLIIASFCTLEDAEAKRFRPRIIQVDERNRPRSLAGIAS